MNSPPGGGPPPWGAPPQQSPYPQQPQPEQQQGWGPPPQQQQPGWDQPQPQQGWPQQQQQQQGWPQQAQQPPMGWPQQQAQPPMGWPQQQAQPPMGWPPQQQTPIQTNYQSGNNHPRLAGLAAFVLGLLLGGFNVWTITSDGKFYIKAMLITPLLLLLGLWRMVVGEPRDPQTNQPEHWGQIGAGVTAGCGLVLGIIACVMVGC